MFQSSNGCACLAVSSAGVCTPMSILRLFALLLFAALPSLIHRVQLSSSGSLHTCHSIGLLHLIAGTGSSISHVNRCQPPLLYSLVAQRFNGDLVGLGQGTLGALPGVCFLTLLWPRVSLPASVYMPMDLVRFSLKTNIVVISRSLAPCPLGSVLVLVVMLTLLSTPASRSRWFCSASRSVDIPSRRVGKYSHCSRLLPDRYLLFNPSLFSSNIDMSFIPRFFIPSLPIFNNTFLVHVNSLSHDLPSLLLQARNYVSSFILSFLFGCSRPDEARRRHLQGHPSLPPCPGFETGLDASCQWCR